MCESTPWDQCFCRMVGLVLWPLLSCIFLVALLKQIEPTYVIVRTNLSIYYAQLFSMFNKRYSLFTGVDQSLFCSWGSQRSRALLKRKPWEQVWNCCRLLYRAGLIFLLLDWCVAESKCDSWKASSYKLKVILFTF